MGNCVEVCKVTLRHTPGLGPSPPPHRPSPGTSSQDVMVLNGYPSTSAANGAIRHGIKEKYRPRPLSAKAGQSQAEIFKKRLCDDIRPPTPSQIKALEDSLKNLDGINSPSGLGKTTAVVFSLRNNIGNLANALRIFQENNINVVHIESRKSQRRDSEYDIYVDVETDTIRLEELVNRLKNEVATLTFNELSVPLSPPPLAKEASFMEQIPWYPRKISELDKSAHRVLMYGSELDADHPGFKDTVYRQRRKFFTDVAMAYRHGENISRIVYTDEEVSTWGTVFRELMRLYPTHACREYLANIPLLVEHCGYREDNVPQLEDVSNFLQARTGFSVRPVAGYLSSRDFLAGLAFRVFHCTQYIRHSSDPFYTPEPDCCHELMGHVPLLADASFAQFSQELGLASLGASDDDVARLATCYFFSVEFGMCKQDSQLRAYGAGLLSSVGELRHALSDKSEKKRFEPLTTCKQVCRITTFQDCYFYTESFEEAKEHMRQFAATIKRPFAVRFNAYTQSVEVLDSTRLIATVVSELRGDLCIISDALRRLQLLEQYGGAATSSPPPDSAASTAASFGTPVADKAADSATKRPATVNPDQVWASAAAQGSSSNNIPINPAVDKLQSCNTSAASASASTSTTITTTTKAQDVSSTSTSAKPTAVISPDQAWGAGSASAAASVAVSTTSYISNKPSGVQMVGKEGTASPAQQEKNGKEDLSAPAEISVTLA